MPLSEELANLAALAEKATPGKWHWVIHDVSLASLGMGSDPGDGTPLVLNVSPCKSCTASASPKVWEWGRCTTPSEADARFIAAANPETIGRLIEEIASLRDQVVVLDLIREEAGKDNAPFGRSDSMALNRIRAALSSSLETKGEGAE